MRIQCPDCAAAYEVPDTMLVPGRAVRCTRCGTRWQPMAAAGPAASPAAEPPPDTEPMVESPPAVADGGGTAEATPPLPAVPAGSPAARRRHPLRPRPRPAPMPEADPDRVLMAEPARALLASREAPALMLPAPLPAGAPRAGLLAPLLAWLVSLLLVGGALAALWIWRAELAAAWPPASRLFQALGLD
ncbi:zinc-ribbon domain-containing protein [Teichococcus vastitatis]|uniref:Zinc-ribbon domain-containing protein n=1 Tax=Teichococcus vastitatis TaxID=2307076 RepID=A0ABS9W5B9_9PROT|nr:zinc-ribbon domain-containing protein [Pseudoroseomonas vastitatis]MCI0754489.1 zinc-ribbon domain-containing protein [Pseudoroseomonas vastitatis]